MLPLCKIYDVYCYQLISVNSDDDNNGGVHLALWTCKWNMVNMNLASFKALNSNINGMHH